MVENYHAYCYRCIWRAEFASEQGGGMSAEALMKAFAATEDGFLSLVRKHWLTKPQLASVGSCCLVGVVFAGMLYVANAGDSRAVLGRLEKGFRDVTAVQLTAEHNASNESVRAELQSLHPGDSQIVVLRHNVWRVKGLIQVKCSSMVVRQSSFLFLISKFTICMHDDEYS